jgi:membrane protein implicated in regulation of membrane protease activity
MNGLADAVGRVAESARSVVQLEVQAAMSDMKRKVAALGIGIGLALLALLLVGLAIIFGLAAATVGLTHWLSVWASLLVMCGALVVLALFLAGFGLTLMRRGSKSAPAKTLGENEQEA